MKKILLIILFNMLTIALIYSTYIKSRRTTAEVPKGATVVTEDKETPDDKVLYGKEYFTLDIEIYLEEDMEEEYVSIFQEVLARFPAGVAKRLSEEYRKVIIYSDQENKGNDKDAIYIHAESKEDIQVRLTDYLIEYTDKVYGITKSDEFLSLTDEDFKILMNKYITDNRTLKRESPEIYEYFDSMFKESESIEDIIKRN